ncbi:Flp family type IVb pilin [uncultured Sphingomonas sp.]|uniref:Flp family type IVb pilin n=1 Tax=uncultured Sphingomonas sp. TaxID=158754 RepID=UPI0035CC86A4
MDAPPTCDKSAARRSYRVPVDRLLRDRRGATAVEYGFILALIVLAMIGALTDVGNVTSSMWNNINTKVTNAQ